MCVMISNLSSNSTQNIITYHSMIINDAYMLFTYSSSKRCIAYKKNQYITKYKAAIIFFINVRK